MISTTFDTYLQTWTLAIIGSAPLPSLRTSLQILSCLRYNKQQIVQHARSIQIKHFENESLTRTGHRDREAAHSTLLYQMILQH